MSHARIYAANAGQQFWLALLDLAMLPDWQSHVASLASESGWSHTSIEKRCRAIRWHLEQGILPEVIAEMGAERTVSDWQQECNLRRGRAPGQAKYFKLKLPVSQVEGLQGLLKRIRTLLGCDEETAVDEILSRYQHLEDSEIKS